MKSILLAGGAVLALAAPLAARAETACADLAKAGPGTGAGGPPSQVLCPFPGVAKKTGDSYACAVPMKTKG